MAPITAFHKIAKRRFDDISSVAVAFALRLGTDGSVADDQDRAGRGGGDAAARPGDRGGADRAAVDPRDRAPRRPSLMAEAGTPMSDHRASADYRAAMLRTSLLKFYARTPHRRCRRSDS